MAALLSWLPALPYPPAQEGRWSPVTSTLNWCEEDYYATIYAAEVVNTLTNLLFMYLAAKGIHNCVKYGHDTVFLVAFIGYLLVGSGSFFFHATLKYPMQLVDELSMIYTTGLMCFATFSYGKSRQYSLFLGTALISLVLSITLYYHYLQDPVFHQNAYAILTAVALFRAMYVMESSLRPRLHDSKKGWSAAQAKNGQRDRDILRQMWVMIAFGLSIFLGGFLLWHLDNVYCATLRRWRREIGMPWGFLLEGHGWWHLMTGIGAYFYIVWAIWLRHCLNGRQDEFVLDWPGWMSMPTVVAKAPNGHSNGYTFATGKKKQ